MKRHIPIVLGSIALASSPLLVLTALLNRYPVLAPGFFWTVPIGLVAGYSMLWRRYPRYAFPIGLVFVPIVGVALVYCAIQVWWYLLGGYI